MKVYIDKDEMYPVFYLFQVDSFSYGSPIEIPDELFEDYKKIEQAYHKMQLKLEQLFNQDE